MILQLSWSEHYQKITSETLEENSLRGWKMKLAMKVACGAWHQFLQWKHLLLY